MKFVVLLTGEGGGCDYTIACNKDWKKIEANSVEDAMNQVKDMIAEYSEPAIEHDELIEIKE